MSTTTSIALAAQAAPVPPLASEGRDDLIDWVLAVLADMVPAERKALLLHITKTLEGLSPSGTALLVHRARVSFWGAALDLARLDAGEVIRGTAISASVAASPIALGRFLERRAWSAATVLPLRSVFDLLPRELRTALDDLARAVAQAAPQTTTQ